MCRCHLHLDLLSVEKKYDIGLPVFSLSPDYLPYE